MAVACEVCGVIGQGKGWGIKRPMFDGLAPGWTVHRQGMTGARPRCPAHPAHPPVSASAETVEMEAVKLESEGDVQQAKEQ